MSMMRIHKFRIVLINMKNICLWEMTQDTILIIILLIQNYRN